MTVQASDAGTYARQGVWTDYQRGANTGLTLSLSEQNAAILIAALALFIQMTGNRLWVILRFLIHQLRVSVRARPGFYHQQQAFLRNSGSSAGFIMDMVNLTIRWRKSFGHAIGSVSVISIPALLHLICLVTLGVLSSKLVKVGDRVTISSPYCMINNADLAYANSSNYNQSVTHSVYVSNLVQGYIKYARSCYSAEATEKGLCSQYVVPNISYSASHNLSCPFDRRVCHTSATASKFDTGLFDVGRTLGINLESSKQLNARKITTCVPLNDTAYVKVNDMRSPSGLNGSSAYYGPQYGNLNTDSNSTFSSANVFREMTIDQKSYFRIYELAKQHAYQPSAYLNYSTVFDLRTFIPIQELASIDGDLSLVFMTFPGSYTKAVDDLWFSAHHHIQSEYNTTATSVTSEVFTKDIPISTMACIDQYQICLQDACTNVAGLLQVANETDAWVSNLTYAQTKALVWLAEGFRDTGVNNCIMEGGGTLPLLAADQVYSQASESLPNGQWRREAEYWFTISLTWLQASIIQYGTGQALDGVSWINTTMSSAQRDFCDSLIIRGTSLQSFNLFALILIFVLGILVMMLSLSIESLAGFVQQRYHKGIICKQMWRVDGLLQLQKSVYEARNEGTWTGLGNSVPVTRPDEMLEPLDAKGNGRKMLTRGLSDTTMVERMMTTEVKSGLSAESSLMSDMDHSGTELPSAINPVYSIKRKSLVTSG